MFERFTERARQVVVLAQDEARALGHAYIGTEHILLGLVREPAWVAGHALANLGVTLELVREQVRRIVGEGASAATTGQIPFTPRGKKTLELALRESRALGHDYIGTEHILLGLVRLGEGVASDILAALGTDEESVRHEVTRLLPRPAEAPQGRPRVGPRRHGQSRPPWPLSPVWMLLAGLLFALGVGILAGWAIWG